MTYEEFVDSRLSALLRYAVMLTGDPHLAEVFPADCQRLDGSAALDLLRQRRYLPQGAHDRDRNGHRFAAALMAQANEAGLLRDPIRLSAVARATADSVTLDMRGRSLPQLLGALRVVATSDPVGIGWQSQSRPVAGVWYEQLDSTVSAELFAALRGDAVADWVVRYPDHVTR